MERNRHSEPLSQVCCRFHGSGLVWGWRERALVNVEGIRIPADRPVSATDRVTLTFPIGEGTDVVYVEKQRYVLTRRRDDVVDIDPPGRCCPLYQLRRAPPAHGDPLRQQRARGMVARYDLR